MKFIKLSSVILTMLCALFLFACKKDKDLNENVKPVPEDTTVTLLTKAYYYYAQSDTAGMGPIYVDSIYYNDDKQVVKVMTAKLGGEVITYLFAYNNNGSLATMSARGNAESSFYYQDYNIHYGNNRIDSITLIDSTFSSTYTETILMTYGANGMLQKINSLISQDGNLLSPYKMIYTSGVNDKIDSVNVQTVSGDVISSTRTISPSSTVSPVNAAMLKVDKGYLFMLASRQDALLIRNTRINLFTQHLLNPSKNMFNDGFFSFYYSNPSNNKMNQEYKSVCAFNADSTLRTYNYAEGTPGATVEAIYIKFAYTTK